ncbi:MucB/RseB C-terminal domain-containing protein [Tepidimonas charontis]|uniref:Sigma factor AlgU regulatory protein MucB n=1 Tax=Tepidimonas charontis TaxID=2267262 RepID=A0A554XJP1_9BURK|nr:MucB/RseB C-terminal domain-containing protein [Tepidimonas charontis]TSE36043.1 Sigma factor AlgU regulatory protein MucB [Tepidimonas charontis]
MMGRASSAWGAGRWTARLAALVLSWVGLGAAWAQVAAPAGPPAADIEAWIQRLHEATRARAYSGTFVVTRGSDMMTARVVHVCDGRQQIERIEVLDGPARVTWRRDDEVLILRPDKQWGVRDRRELLRAFPGPLARAGFEVAQHYRAVLRGSERQAGWDAWVVDFRPRDQWRYAYRIWSEKSTGLLLKLQILGADDAVLEQMAFTELQLDIPVRLEALARQMEATRGYRIERPSLRKTALEAEGWRLNAEVPGFRPVTCWARDDAAARHPLHCVFSDGLASLSLFFAPADAGAGSGRSANGATHVLAQRVGGYAVTALGEVPPQTLERFLAAVERTR